MDPIEQLLRSVIQEAGKLTIDFFGKSQVTHTKNDETDVVTNADIASSNLILSGIKKYFPNHGIISEEEEDIQTDSEYVWNTPQSICHIPTNYFMHEEEAALH